MARILGLDIGTTAVRGTLIRTALRKLEILQYVEVPLIPTTHAADRADQVREGVRSLLATMKPAPEVIVAALEGEEASVRTVELPAAAAKRIGEVLPFEM